eukprot:6470513-Ditylum_brightwellii.AAC.1
MAKHQPQALATCTRKCFSLMTGRKGQYTQTNSNGVDLENIKRGLCALSVDNTKYAKEVAIHHATKAAKMAEERLPPLDLNNIKMTYDNKEIDTNMADDTESTL